MAYKCPICGQVVGNWPSLIGHVKLQHPELLSPRDGYCPLCGEPLNGGSGIGMLMSFYWHCRRKGDPAHLILYFASVNKKASHQTDAFWCVKGKLFKVLKV